MISVCLASYNGSKYITEQINSILDQISQYDEIVISDDGSNDDTIDVIRKINDKRVKIVFNKGRKGVAGNFENALKHCSGDYIFLSDQDDVWMDKKVEKILKALDVNDCVLHNAELIDSNGESLNNNLFSIYKTRTGYINNLIRNTFVGCCMAFRKEMLQYVLPMPKPITMHDMWIALICEKKGKTILLPENLIKYRRHENNASTTSKKSKFTRYYQLKYRLAMFYYTMIR